MVVFPAGQAVQWLWPDVEEYFPTGHSSQFPALGTYDPAKQVHDVAPATLECPVGHVWHIPVPPIFTYLVDPGHKLFSRNSAPINDLGTLSLYSSLTPKVFGPGVDGSPKGVRKSYPFFT